MAYAASASAKKGAELFGSSRLGPPSMRDAKGTRSLDRKSTLRPLAAPGRLANPGPKLREPFGLQAPSIGGATLHTAKTHRRLPSMDEAPKDLKSNLRRAWMELDQTQLQSCSPSGAYKASTFALCVYHSLILGRRRFGSQGWSTPYSFNTGDLQVCIKVLFAHITA